MTAHEILEALEYNMELIRVDGPLSRRFRAIAEEYIYKDLQAHINRGE